MPGGRHIGDTAFAKRFGQRLRRERRRALLTQKQLGLKADIHYRTIKQWEGGHTTPMLIYAQRLARALGITVDDLLQPI